MITYNRYMKALAVVQEYKKQVQDLHNHLLTVKSALLEPEEETPNLVSITPDSLLHTVATERLQSFLRINGADLGIVLTETTTVSELGNIRYSQLILLYVELFYNSLNRKSAEEILDICYAANVKLNTGEST